MAVATYLQIAEQLEAEISALPPGTRIASEKEFASIYGVNRLTARAAIQELERRFRVRRRPGNGTFVSERVEFRITVDSPPSWSETIRRAGAEPRSETLSLRTQRAATWLRDILGLAPQGRVVHLKRLRYVNGETACVADTYLVAELVPDLRMHLSSDGSLHNVLSQIYDLDPVRGMLSMDLEVAPVDVARYLGFETRPMLFHGIARSDSRRLGRPLQVTTTWNRPDVLRIVFDLSASR